MGEAKRKYRDDPEVTKFLTEFSDLMATHFSELAKTSDGPKQPGPSEAATSSCPGLAGGSEVPNPDLPPHVQEALRDAEVKALIASVQAGRPLEMHALAQENPRLFSKVKILLDA